MAKSKYSLDERVTDKKRQLDELLKKAKQYEEQLKRLENQKKEEDRKARAHRLIEVGASVESIVGQPIEKEKLPALISFLKDIEERDHALSSALGIYKGEETHIEAGFLSAQ